MEELLEWNNDEDLASAAAVVVRRVVVADFASSQSPRGSCCAHNPKQLQVELVEVF
jgi:hypothetical protein